MIINANKYSKIQAKYVFDISQVILKVTIILKRPQHVLTIREITLKIILSFITSDCKVNDKCNENEIIDENKSRYNRVEIFVISFYILFVKTFNVI